MARCETTHWTLDCGEGHGCGLVEFSDTGELAGWFCASTPTIGKRKPSDQRPLSHDPSTKLELCSHHVDAANLAAALSEITGLKISASDTVTKERRDFCHKGTLQEILEHGGLVLHR